MAGTLAATDANSALLPIRKDPSMQHLRVLSLRIGVTAALVLAALPVAGWKWG
jgi:hypothetical protein